MKVKVTLILKRSINNMMELINILNTLKLQEKCQQSKMKMKKIKKLYKSIKNRAKINIKSLNIFSHLAFIIHQRNYVKIKS